MRPGPVRSLIVAGELGVKVQPLFPLHPIFNWHFDVLKEDFVHFVLSLKGG